MIRLAVASLLNRKASAWLTILAIAVSTLLLLGVERVRHQTQENFANTISGTDLIVGARTGNTQLLLSSVFHIGALSNTLSWQSYQHLQTLRGVAWHIPIALGDSFGEFPVVATSTDFFEHFRYADRQALVFTQGDKFNDAQSAVLGAEVAKRRQLKLGDKFTISHGSGGISFSDHDAHPFTVNGILERTGTPVDQAVYMPLSGLGLVHGESSSDTTHEGEHDHTHEHSHEPPVYTLSAVLLGLSSRPLALRMQRDINTYQGEPLTAIMPGMALTELWRTLNLFEKALLAVSTLVVATGLLGMLTALLSSLRERRREMAVLRAVGAGPITIFGLLVSEALILAIVGVGIGIGMLYLIIGVGGEALLANTGILLRATPLTTTEWSFLAAIILAALVLSFIPAWRAYRNALADGLTIRV
ncbi:ABC transporter permease [Pseudidiomarina woesei]|uniref:ABC-type transport system, involved in lipoprotein release, permease component n=1 Tax=Pseudidiomarina woesei TaxID=1381080 RepID=A0A0K6HB97_9GAMM|nr:ABC transporter permease [Pseudidiomarina woesei]CUA88035.1 ABC-type transport system, involved in lipoprotein release, permease component [Pseudidiomarina woesei]